MFVYFNIPEGTHKTKTRASFLNLRDNNLRKNEGLFGEAFIVHLEFFIQNEVIG
jgi:hypothetical protein